MKNRSVVTVIVAIVVCLALVLSFFLGRTSVEHEKQPIIPTATVKATTAVPTETPTPTSSLSQEMEEVYNLLDSLFDSYEIKKFVTLNGKNHTYYTYTIRVLTGHRFVQYMQLVFVVNGIEVVDIISVYANVHDMFSSILADKKYAPVLEADVNFDGKEDLLIYCGGSGVRYVESYECYLQTNYDGFENCPSYGYIPNPKIDAELKGIRGYIQDGAMSHSGTVYQYIDGNFEIVEQMTEFFYIEDENGNIKDWESSYWVVEKLIDGQLVITDTFSEEGMTEAEKEILRETLRTFDSYYSLYSK